MLADDDVARLDVAVQHAAAVGVVDRVADVEEPAEQPAQLQADCRPGIRRPPTPALPHKGEGALMFALSWKLSMAALRRSPRMNRMA